MEITKEKLETFQDKIIDCLSHKNPIKQLWEIKEVIKEIYKAGQVDLVSQDSGWFCLKCQKHVENESVTFEEHHDNCGGKCI